MNKGFSEVKNEVKSDEKSDEKSDDNFFLISVRYIQRIIKIFLSISGFYFIWILLHYFASHLYVKLCVPNTFFGFIISPFLITTPYCIGLRWLIQTGATSINNMWIIFGTWICSNILNMNTNTN